MKFKIGSEVEVLRNEHHFGSWLPAKILSAHGQRYTARFELFLTAQGKPVVERVNEEDVRPCPPPAREKGRWIVGDIAEVFDVHSWRAGKIVKVLSNDFVLVRLYGSIQLKEFHISDLRVQQAWCNNQWVMIGKVRGKKQFHNDYTHCSFAHPIHLGCEAHKEKCKGACKGKRSEQNHVGQFSPLKAIKANINSYGTLVPGDGVRGTGKKRKANQKADGCHQPTKRARPQKVDTDTFSKHLVGKNCWHLSSEDKIIKYASMDTDKGQRNNQPIHLSSTRLQIVEGNNECSVASCSGSNFPEYTNQDARKYSGEFASSSFDGASSSSPSDPRNMYGSVPEDEFAANIHKLELHAYQSTMQALYASGPLSWEQESLLTNLRLSLNISNDEHLLQLRHLLAA